MARPYRIQYEDATYLVTIRGPEKKKIFKSDEDCERFVMMIGEAAQKHEVKVYCFAISSNAVELVVETPRANVSSYCQGLQTGYAQYYRQKYRFKGRLVRDRFRSKVVEKDACILPLSRYIHSTPLREYGVGKKTAAQKRKIIRSYKWTSYRSYIGEGKPVPYIDTKPVMQKVTGVVAKRPAKYREYVEEAIDSVDEAFDTLLAASPLGIGSEKFNKELKSMHTKFVSGKKPAKLRVYGQKQRGVSRAKVLDAVAKGMGIDKALFTQQKKNALHRPIASYMLYRHGNLSQDEIAATLKLTSGAAVSLQMRRLIKLLPSDEALQKKLAKIDKVLSK